MKHRLGIYQALFALYVGSASAAEVEYIAPALRAPSPACDSRPFPAVDDLEANWFSSQWKAAGEPSLYAQSLSQDARFPKSYRFTWLRTFHAPIVIRLEENSEGHMRFIAKRLTGFGGYKPGHVGAILRRRLNDVEENQVHQELAASNFASLAPTDCVIGVDGSQWIFETRIGSTYSFVNRWSPNDGPVRRLGELLLKFTRWNVDPVY
jgi:hypothetical protein